MRPLEENFRILRVRVESQLPTPALVVVSSAMRGDGTTYVACGLARAFAESGRRTLLVDANVANPGVAEELGLRVMGAGGTRDAIRAGVEVPRLFVAPLGKGKPHELLEAMRSEYDVTVVDAAAIPTDSVAMQLATLADGLLLTLRLGRRPAAADEELLRLLGDGKVKLLGVVPTRARARRGRPVPLESPAAAVTTESPRGLMARVGVGR